MLEFSTLEVLFKTNDCTSIEAECASGGYFDSKGNPQLIKPGTLSIAQCLPY